MPLPCAPFALIVPLLAIPPPIVLPTMASAAEVPKIPGTTAPGVMVPALVTAPMTDDVWMKRKLVALPAEFITEDWLPLTMRPGPASAGAVTARSSDAAEVVANNAVAAQRRPRPACGEVGPMNDLPNLRCVIELLHRGQASLSEKRAESNL